jgi:phosphoglycerate dehydrogenase-like enzyme
MTSEDVGPGGAPRVPRWAAEIPSARSPGVPDAIALSPILSGRYRQPDLDRIGAAAPGARLVMVSTEGRSDHPLDEVEVLLSGWLSPEAIDRVLARAPRLRWVHSAIGGVESMVAATRRDPPLLLTNARGVFSRPVAEYVLMMILAIARRLPELMELQKERTWQPLEGRELRDVTIGIVGYGSIGREVARLAAPFGCRIVATRRNPSLGSAAADGSDGAGEDGSGTKVDVMLAPEELPQLLREADFVVLAAPLTEATENLVDDRALALMRPGAWLVNVSRGGLVDERALLRVLREGAVGGAVLDTFRQEPLPPTSPFYELPNVILTPLTSWSSGRVLDRSVELFCDNLRRYAAGRPLRNLVDPAAGY